MVQKFFETKRNVILIAVVVTLVLAAAGVGLFFLLRKKTFSKKDLEYAIWEYEKRKGYRV